MTTVIGIANDSMGIALLAADRQGTIGQHSNPAIPMDKTLGRKLWVSRDGVYAFGHSGLRDERLLDFASKMVDGNIDVRQVVDTGKFNALREFNIDRLGYHVSDLNNLSSFLLITNFDNKPLLYSCFPFGAVERRDLTYIGSGSERAHKYFEGREVIIEAMDYLPRKENKNSRKEGMLIVGLEALRYAQGKDPYSSGLDLVVATPNGIKDHFADLQDDFSKRLDGITSQYKDPTPPSN